MGIVFNLRSYLTLIEVSLVCSAKRQQYVLHALNRYPSFLANDVTCSSYGTTVETVTSKTGKESVDSISIPFVVTLVTGQLIFNEKVVSVGVL